MVSLWACTHGFFTLTLGSEKVLCVGMNYVDHCLEQNVPIPKEPLIFRCDDAL